jgi:hypothetical protein
VRPRPASARIARRALVRSVPSVRRERTNLTDHTTPPPPPPSPHLARSAVATSDAKENDAPKSTAIPERDYGPEAEIARLQAQADAFTRKTELEKRAVRDLEKEVETMRSRVETQRKKMGGLDAAQRANNQIQKKIKMLETKLDKSLCRFNEAKSHNKTLRLTIDNLRKERAVFAEVYRKLEKDLDAKKADMGVIVEESDRAYEARDRAVAEMAKLKMQADKEQASFENEWRELGKLIEHDRKMKEFMRNRRKVNEDDGKLGTLSLEEEKKLKKKIIKGNWGNIKTKARQSTVQTKVHSYTEAFEKIKAAAGIGASRSARLGFVFLGGGSRPVSSPPTSRRFKRVHVGIVGRIARSLARSLSLAHPRHRATTPPVRVLSLSQTTSTRS